MTKLTPAEYEALPWLHLYAQFVAHDKAYIFGSREALTVLRDCIDHALADENGAAAMNAVSGDGEGYAVQIRRLPPSLIRRSRLPYTGTRRRFG